MRALVLSLPPGEQAGRTVGSLAATLESGLLTGGALVADPELSAEVIGRLDDHYAGPGRDDTLFPPTAVEMLVQRLVAEKSGG